MKDYEGKYQALYHVMQEGLCLHEMIYDASGKAVDYRILECNQAYARITGISREKCTGALASDVYGRTGLVHLDTFAQVVASGTSATFETYCASSDQYLRVAVCSPGPSRFAILVTDISRCRRAEQALAAEKEWLRVTLHSIGDGVIIADPEGRVTLLNLVAEALTGWQQHEAAGRPVNEVFCLCHRRTGARCEDIVAKVLRSGATEQLAKDTVLRARDGSQRLLDDTAAPIRDSHGNVIGVVLVFRDITARAEMEDELRYAHKMEAVGTLAGGLAHEFNNILGIVMGNAELARDDIPEWNPARINLEQIKSASLRAKDVVRQLLTFSHRMEQNRHPTDLSRVVKETLNVLRTTLPPNIELKDNLAERCHSVLADPVQIHQMVINLAANAVYAMEAEGGTLEITLQNDFLATKETAPGGGGTRGECVLLQVSDTGSGISPDILDRIFDPYFTTKDIGKGTGMGLAVVYGIVESHGGTVRVETQVGQGTTFKVFLPAIRNPATAAVENKETPSTGGTERILLVDDEEQLARLTSMQLKRLGYRVKWTTDPQRALKLFAADPGGFDLVITDMVMPGLTGDQLTQALRAQRADIRIILCTGFSEHMDAARARQLGATAYVLKPFQAQELACLVREVLDQESS